MRERSDFAVADDGGRHRRRHGNYWVYATTTFKYVADGLGIDHCLVWRSDMIVYLNLV